MTSDIVVVDWAECLPANLGLETFRLLRRAVEASAMVRTAFNGEYVALHGSEVLAHNRDLSAVRQAVALSGVDKIAIIYLDPVVSPRTTRGSPSSQPED